MQSPHKWYDIAMKRTDINKRLAEYFSDDQLEGIDDLSREVLLDTTSAFELRQLAATSTDTIKATIQEHLSREILRRLAEIHEDELPTMLDWYNQNADMVETIHCPDKSHKTDIVALKVNIANPEFNNTHTNDGVFVVGIVGKLLSYRQRLDGVVGFQCICGNDNMWSKVENDNISKEHKHSVLTPDDMFRVRQAVEQSNYQPAVKKLKLGYAIDSFEHRKVK